MKFKKKDSMDNASDQIGEIPMPNTIPNLRRLEAEHGFGKVVELERLVKNK